MEAKDIKKAFELMKKGLKKELNLEGGFTMSKRQIELGRATFAVNNNRSYEAEIIRLKKDDERVQGYSTWTDEEKKRSHERTLDYISKVEETKEKFGTKENECLQTIDAIRKSEAFKNFRETVGGCWIRAP